MIRLLKALSNHTSSVVIGVLLVTTIAAASALFAQSDQTSRVIDAAYQLDHTAAGITALTGLRGSLAVALLVGVDASAGRRSETDRDQVADDVVAISEAVRSRVEALAPTHPQVAERAAQIERAARDVAAAVRASDLVQAQHITRTVAIPAVERLTTDLDQIRTDAIRSVRQEEGRAGAAARGASIAVALLVPTTAIATYRRYQRRREQQREMELALRHQEEQSALKDRMIANLSHQLRTPLTGIYGMASALLEQGFGDVEFSRDAAGIIVDEASRLTGMVDDLLTATKLSAGSLTVVRKPVDPVAVVREVTEAQTEPVAVECEAAAVLADPIRLRQVVRNLVSNAVVHGAGTRAVEGRVEAGAYVIRVSDEGQGVPADRLDHMFERFAQYEPVATGTLGLGMAIAAELSELMDATLSYRRDGGKTLFELRLLLAAGPDPLILT